MGLFSRKAKKANLNWKSIQSIEDLEQAYNSTKEKAALFFKHSTRCNISSMVLNRFEKEWEENEECQLFFIDLITHRDVSNKLAELAGVEHQSPQAILVKNKKAIHNASHGGISASTLKNLI